MGPSIFCTRCSTKGEGENGLVKKNNQIHHCRKWHTFWMHHEIEKWKKFGCKQGEIICERIHRENFHFFYRRSRWTCNIGLLFWVQHSLSWLPQQGVLGQKKWHPHVWQSNNGKNRQPAYFVRCIFGRRTNGPNKVFIAPVCTNKKRNKQKDRPVYRTRVWSFTKRASCFSVFNSLWAISTRTSSRRMACVVKSKSF